jgi:hypothetical protein
MLSPPTQRHHIVVVPDDELDARPTGWTGDVTLECLADLVQLLSMAQTSGALHVRDAEERRGCLWFHNGSVVDASTQALRGEEAVYEMLTWRSGSFLLDAEARAVRFRIQHSVAQLLLEGMCRNREESTPPPPPSAAWIEPLHSSLEDERARKRERSAVAFQSGLELVREKNYAGALAEWERANECDPGNRLIQTNLRRLRQLIAREQTMRGEHGDQK